MSLTMDTYLNMLIYIYFVCFLHEQIVFYKYCFLKIFIWYCCKSMHFLYTRSCIAVTFTALLCNSWSHTDIWFCSLGFQTTNVLQLVLLKSNARHVLGYGDVTALVTLLVECRSTGDWLYANNYWYTLHRQWDGEYSHTSPLLKWKVSTALYLNLECSFGDIILFDGDQVLSTSLIVMCLSWVFGNDHVLLTLLIVGYLS